MLNQGNQIILANFYHPKWTILCEVKKFGLSLQPDRFGGGIGRHAGLKIPWAAMPVRVRFPSEAHIPLDVFREGFLFSLPEK